jgi:protein SCO1
MQQRALWVGVVSVVIVAMGAVILLLTNKPTLHGSIIDPPLAASEIHLRDFKGQDFTLSSLRGRIAILYFGYTNCPDECPLTMAHLKLAKEKIGTASDQVQVVMISTDPKRDTPQAMQDFLTKFGPDFNGVVGTEEQLAPVWKDYGVTVQDNGETHSFFIYVIDRHGNFRETLLPDSEPADIAADLRLLLSEK